VKAEPTAIPGCQLVRLDRPTDARGDFVKLFGREVYEAQGMDSNIAEVYWSTSGRGVVRGLHFQTPPHAHAKTVTVVRGAIVDVVVDLRVGSPMFGQHLTFELSGAEPAAVHIPLGCAHGFQAVSDEAIVEYLVGTEHAPDHDTGVRWDSAGIEWPVGDPIVSERDRGFPTLATFESPFRL
jgi:dTDP-4-dehydrorhamnose 3,5-epimerase